MIYLNSVKIKAFRSFVDETTFTLPNNGLVLINGLNLDTNDASGTGKSTLFYAVAFALNVLSGISAKELQCLFTKEKMQVTLTLTDDKLGIIVIGKGKDNFIEYSGSRLEGAKLVAEHTERVFGLTSELLSTLMYRPQDSGGLILSKTSTQLVEFLSTLLGLDVIDAALELSSVKIKDLTKEADSLDAQIKSKTETLKNITLIDLADVLAENKTIKSGLLELESEKTAIELARKEAETDKSVKDKEIDEKYSAIKSQAKELILKLEKEDIDLRSEVETNNTSVNRAIKDIDFDLFIIKATKTEIPKLQKEIDTLLMAVCPTCERDWLEANGKLVELQKKMAEKETLLKNEPILLKARADAQAQLKTFTANQQIQDLRLTIKSLDISAINEKNANVSSDYVNQISSIMRKQADLTAIVSKNNIKIEKNSEAQRIHGQITKDIETLSTLKTNKDSELQVELDFTKVVGKKGFLGSIFDEILAEIESSINQKLALVANVGHIIFKFKTESLDSKGLTKKSITPVININGNEASLATLSGGMKSSLAIITDLAVKETIESRTGKAIGWFFADEVFNGQGQPTKEACLDILKQASQSRALFVIDHHSEMKEHFNKIIDIRMSNGVSTIV